jgi:hypothetical protein
MEVSIPEDVKKDPELGPGVERATRVLEEEVGKPNSRVTADWSLFPDVGPDRHLRPAVRLRIVDGTLSDWNGFVESLFSLPELNSVPAIVGRLVAGPVAATSREDRGAGQGT